MNRQQRIRIFNTLETLVDTAELKEILPGDGTPITKPLSLILGRELVPEKSSRNYALSSFSAANSLALPFMRAGQNSFLKGEGLFIGELLREVKVGKSNLNQLILSAAGESQNYRYSQLVGSEMAARAYLKTTGSDSYDSVFSELIKILSDEGALDSKDKELLEEGLIKAELDLAQQEVVIINPLPGYESKFALKKSVLKTDFPSTYSGFIAHEVQVIDNRRMNFESLTPVIKDLLISHKEGSLSPSSLGLASFNPILSVISKTKKVLGIVFLIEDGRIKKLTLQKIPEGEEEPPQFGPVKAMLSVNLSLLAGKSDEELVLKAISKYSSRSNFISTSTLGAISLPDNQIEAYEGVLANSAVKGDVIEAVETFVLVGQNSKALKLDPVAVPYQSADDLYENFEMTRLCFYSLDKKLTPPLQGCISFGVDLTSYESCALDLRAKTAFDILKTCSNFITGECGRDGIVNSKNEALELLFIKYGKSTASSNFNKRSWGKLICGALGPTNGMVSEIYSLFYQDKIETSPTLFSASVNTPRFLSNVRTFGQRFSLSRFLNEE